MLDVRRQGHLQDGAIVLEQDIELKGAKEQLGLKFYKTSRNLLIKHDEICNVCERM